MTRSVARPRLQPEPEPRATEPPGDRPKVYNRSSFHGEFLVVIPDQTAEDFERYAPEKQFCEYFDGTIYMPSPVSDRHQDHTAFLFHLLDGLRCERGIGKVLTGPAILGLTEEHRPEPDIFVRPPGGGPNSIPRAILVIEVLSPSNRSYGPDLKGSFYREAGLPEIWYVDDRDKVLVIDRKFGEEYRIERIGSGVVIASALPGFWIDVAWLWDDPLPNARRCLEAILAGPPAGD